MLRFVATPFDIDACYAACGRTVSEVSENTGIPEDELRRNAAGIHPLGAKDRFAIMRVLNEPRLLPEESEESARDTESDEQRAMRRGTSRLAYMQLRIEMEQEEQEEELKDALTECDVPEREL